MFIYSIERQLNVRISIGAFEVNGVIVAFEKVIHFTGDLGHVFTYTR